MEEALYASLMFHVKNCLFWNSDQEGTELTRTLQLVRAVQHLGLCLVLIVMKKKKRNMLEIEYICLHKLYLVRYNNIEYVFNDRAR